MSRSCAATKWTPVDGQIAFAVHRRLKIPRTGKQSPSRARKLARPLARSVALKQTICVPTLVLPNGDLENRSK